MEVIVVRGTPEEIREAFPGLDVLMPEGAAAVLHRQRLDEPRSGGVGALPAFLQTYIASRSRPPVRTLVEQLAESLAERGAVFEIGTSQRSDDGLNRYFMVYPAGPRLLGAAAYVHPSNGRVDFRLSADDLTDEDRAEGARPRTVSDGHPYAVTLRLTETADVELATRLAMRALDSAASGG